MEAPQHGREYSFPYAKLENRPTPTNRVREVFPDPELGCEGFTYTLESGVSVGQMLALLRVLGKEVDLVVRSKSDATKQIPRMAVTEP